MADTFDSKSVSDEVNWKKPHYFMGSSVFHFPFSPFSSIYKNKPKTSKHIFKLLWNLTFIALLRISQDFLLRSDNKLFKKRKLP